MSTAKNKAWHIAHVEVLVIGTCYFNLSNDHLRQTLLAHFTDMKAEA